MSEGEIAAARLADTLAHSSLRIVLVESCTCGMAAALLGQCPGISQWLCGSFVVYRQQSKRQWLQIDSNRLKEFSAESIEVSVALASQALSHTDEADVAVSITGHLGPDAPAEKDGRVYLAANRKGALENRQVRILNAASRADRQLEAAIAMLDFASDYLRSN
jgi:nicotinamide-nucleotide amidase